MSETANGLRSATKITKTTKITRNKWSFVIFVSFVAFVLERVPWAVSPSAVSRQAPQTTQPPPPTQAQQRPVFRGGTHFVRVDAYPTSADGTIVEGLAPADFEILEDGKRQTVESFDFVKFEGFTADAERRDPQTQQQGFDMAADPRYRVFVAFVDISSASTSLGAVVVELPLAPFGRGAYSIELTAASAGKTEQRRLTFIMK